MVTEASCTRPGPVIVRRIVKVGGILVLGLLMLGVSRWGFLALHYICRHVGTRFARFPALALAIARCLSRRCNVAARRLERIATSNDRDRQRIATCSRERMHGPMSAMVTRLEVA